VAFIFSGDGGLRKFLVIDNYDSFTYYLVQMFMPYDICIEVHRNNSIALGRRYPPKPFST